jgi:hypothetical protein
MKILSCNKLKQHRYSSLTTSLKNSSKNIARFKSSRSNIMNSNSGSSKIIFNNKFTEKRIKKNLNIYKIYKAYRYRNYRLHCIRLRRLQKKEKLMNRRQIYQKHIIRSNRHAYSKKIPFPIKSSAFINKISKDLHSNDTSIFISAASFNNEKLIKNKSNDDSKKNSNLLTISDDSENDSDIIRIYSSSSSNSIITKSTSDNSSYDNSSLYLSSSGDDTSSLVNCLHLTNLNSEAEKKTVKKKRIKKKLSNVINIKSNKHYNTNNPCNKKTTKMIPLKQRRLLNENKINLNILNENIEICSSFKRFKLDDTNEDRKVCFKRKRLTTPLFFKDFANGNKNSYKKIKVKKIIDDKHYDLKKSHNEDTSVNKNNEKFNRANLNESHYEEYDDSNYENDDNISRFENVYINVANASFNHKRQFNLKNIQSTKSAYFSLKDHEADDEADDYQNYTPINYNNNRFREKINKCTILIPSHEKYHGYFQDSTDKKLNFKDDDSLSSDYDNDNMPNKKIESIITKKFNFPCDSSLKSSFISKTNI